MFGLSKIHTFWIILNGNKPQTNFKCKFMVHICSGRSRLHSLLSVRLVLCRLLFLQSFFFPVLLHSEKPSASLTPFSNWACSDDFGLQRKHFLPNAFLFLRRLLCSFWIAWKPFTHKSNLLFEIFKELCRCTEKTNFSG